MTTREEFRNQNWKKTPINLKTFNNLFPFILSLLKLLFHLVFKNVIHVYNVYKLSYVYIMYIKYHTCIYCILSVSTHTSSPIHQNAHHNHLCSSVSSLSMYFQPLSSVRTAYVCMCLRSPLGHKEADIVHILKEG